MFRFLFFLILISLFSCNQPSDESVKTQQQIDSLKASIAQSYKPGFGEFMSNIQVHHAKLWFAGINKNWQLADFEIHEILEALEDIKKYETDRPESKEIDMLLPAIDSVNTAISNKNKNAFTSSFKLLTNTCNNCHKATNFEFNQVIIPSIPPVSNQEFKPYGAE